MANSSPKILTLAEKADRRTDLVEDVTRGFAATPKTIPCKYLYDARGSELFEEITHQEEYYPTRAETEILEAHAEEIMARLAPKELMEIGSGSSRKTRLLIEAMHAHGGQRYLPFDVSLQAIQGATLALTADYPWLDVVGVLGDFGQHLEDVPHSGKRVVAFLGSTIGNLLPAERIEFLRAVRGSMKADDTLLLGVDLVKEAAIIEDAYNDAAGVTAQFTTNLVRVLNRELEGTLPESAFEHVAEYDPADQRMNIRLRAREEIDARLEGADLDVHFDAGEELHAEVSCKFTRERVQEELAAAGLRLENWFTDPAELFGLAEAVPV